MPPNTSWSGQLNKSEMKLDLKGVGWKSLMNECLLKTEISQPSSEKCLDPNETMDMRHKMASRSAKMFPTPREQVRTEALKILREETYNRLRKQKQEKIVEKEIERLKQLLEKHRELSKKQLEEAIAEKSKRVNVTGPKFHERHPRLWRRRESLEENRGVCHAVETAEAQESAAQEISEPVSCNRKGSPVDAKDEAPALWRESEGKVDIMERFLQETSLLDSNSCESPERECLENAWKTWRSFTMQQKKRKTEIMAYEKRIEAFLAKLKESEPGKAKRSKSCTHRDSKVTVKERAKTADEKKTEIVRRMEEKQQKLQKLMQEVKMSQEEVCQRLRAIERPGERVKVLKTFAGVFEDVEKKLPQFLRRMEAREEERAKRRNEFQERKRKIEEERENAQRRKEEEERRREDEEKRKRAQELREKRRAAREKKEEQRREGAKLRLAEDHHRALLLRSCGLRPWLQLVRERKDQEERAATYWARRLMGGTLAAWRAAAATRLQGKTAKADDFHGRLLARTCFLAWKALREERVKQFQAASDWNDLRATERAFRWWLLFTQREQLEYLDKRERAALSHQTRIKRKCLSKWREYPDLKRLECAKENRKRIWRQKVKDILPDYQPVDVHGDS